MFPVQSVYRDHAFLYEREISFRFYKNTIMSGAQGAYTGRSGNPGK